MFHGVFSHFPGDRLRLLPSRVTRTKLLWAFPHRPPCRPVFSFLRVNSSQRNGWVMPGMCASLKATWKTPSLPNFIGNFPTVFPRTCPSHPPPAERRAVFTPRHSSALGCQLCKLRAWPVGRNWPLGSVWTLILCRSLASGVFCFPAVRIAPFAAPVQVFRCICTVGCAFGYCWLTAVYMFREEGLCPSAYTRTHAHTHTIFFRSLSCLLALLMVSFNEQKIWIWMRSNFYFFFLF